VISMNQAIFRFGRPPHEPVLPYGPGSTEKKLLKQELKRQAGQEIEIPLIIGGKEVRTGNTGRVVMPHDHGHCLATYHKTGPKEAHMAIEAALEAQKLWMSLSWIERSSIMLRAAELMSKKYRHLINAATMLGQGKNVQQAEIDAVCESIDYLRFNVHFASGIYEGQPKDGKGEPAAAQALQLPLHGRGVEVFSLSSATSTGGGLCCSRVRVLICG